MTAPDFTAVTRGVGECEPCAADMVRAALGQRRQGVSCAASGPTNDETNDEQEDEGERPLS